MRLLGLGAFLTVGLSALHLGARWLGYEPEWWYDVTWDFRTVALVGGALGAGLVAGLFGALFGVSIPVPSKRANHVITVLWHYLANGSLVFTFLLLLNGGHIVGDKAEMEAFVKEIGSGTFSFLVAASATGASVSAGLLVIILGLFPVGGRTRLPWAFFAAAPPALLASYWVFAQFGWTSPLWLLLGVLHPTTTVVISAHFVLRDAIAREQSSRGMI